MQFGRTLWAKSRGGTFAKNHWFPIRLIEARHGPDQSESMIYLLTRTQTKSVTTKRRLRSTRTGLLGSCGIRDSKPAPFRATSYGLRLHLMGERLGPQVSESRKRLALSAA